MDENGVLNSYFLISEDKSDSLYPMYFGVSCAFFALKVLSGPDVEDEKWSEIREIILQGSAKLLGLLLWRIQRDSVNTEKHELLQKLVIAQREVEELKRRRHEDAKANNVPDLRKESEEFSPPSDQYSSKGNEELANFKQLESWIRSEAKRYRTVIEQRHHVDAFTEQLRLKDEKLEAFRWQFLSMELESKRLQSYIEGLNNDMSQTRQANMKLEALLLDREAELHFLKEQFALQLKPLTGQKNNLDSFAPDPALAHNAIWSKVKIIKRKPGEIKQQTESTKVEVSQEGQESPFVNQSKDIILTVQSPEKEYKEKDVVMDPCAVQETFCSG